MRSHTPLLTICVPTYDRAVMLNKCLTALYEIQQHNHIFNLIIGNNGSTDETKDVIAHWKPKFSYIDVINHEHNVGYDMNVYSLYKAVNTEYCWLLGDCDSISLDHYEKLEEDLTKGYETLIINTEPSRLTMHSKLYTNYVNFLDEQLWHITKLSSFIIHRKTISTLVLKRYIGSGFIHVGVLTEYLGSLDNPDIYFDKDIHLLYLEDENNERNKPKGSWRLTPFGVWGKCWSQVIMSLPFKVPYDLKQKLMKDHERKFHWFSVKRLIMNKIQYGDSYIKNYKENREFVHMVTVASPLLSDLVMYLPVEYIYIVLRFIKHPIKKLVRKIKK